LEIPYRASAHALGSCDLARCYFAILAKLDQCASGRVQGSAQTAILEPLFRVEKSKQPVVKIIVLAFALDFKKILNLFG
jgi:hypothetical protein